MAAMNKILKSLVKIMQANTHLECRGLVKLGGTFSLQQISRSTNGQGNLNPTANGFCNNISIKNNKRNDEPKSLLAQHLANVGFNLEDGDEDSDGDMNESEDEENVKQAGVYRSKGITVYIPGKHQSARTRRPRIKELPKDMFDDIRVIYFK